MRGLQIFCLILTIIGAINWGFVGLLDFDLVASVFGGADSSLSMIIYSIIGLAGIINIGLLFEIINETDKRK
ncbi:MAG: DUF378 domain-containing protein [Bacilli bacterium]|nr:DUF378 domain-containing protein [Bacilli bacterium]MDD3305332.1 DUF378 domain-containing protein [Bacilli bacterium]MDD4053624.1 DUF378 domain-containing protein [Bacilli bacterium]MDD4411123.1 DUF378 domain-containing protein [Bacilli bacterium]